MKKIIICILVILLIVGSVFMLIKDKKDIKVGDEYYSPLIASISTRDNILLVEAGNYRYGDINQDGITGRRRLCHRVYQAYKVVEDEDGEYELVGSPLVDDIMTVKDEYPYFREDDNFMTYRDLRNINVKRRLR